MQMSNYIHAEGKYVIGSQSSHVEGYADKAPGNYVHAEGYATKRLKQEVIQNKE